MSSYDGDPIVSNHLNQKKLNGKSLFFLIVPMILQVWSLGVSGCGSDGSDEIDAELFIDAALSDGGSQPLDDDGGLQGQDVCSAVEYFCVGSGCVDLLTDPDHCGGCGIACDDGHVCVEGECVYRCPEGQTICDGQCVNLAYDPFNCGECDHACLVGMVCTGGECVISCPEGQITCNGQCVNLARDPDHCGECDHACPSGMVCDDGECALTCSLGLTDCGGSCVDQSSDSMHCDQCGNQCPEDRECSERSCVCLDGLIECDGACIDPHTDLAHCGQCDHPCGAGSVCSGGICVIPVTGVSLDLLNLDLNTGATRQLVAIVAPAHATNQELTWASSHPGVATVDGEGLVEGVSSGQTQISVHTVDGGHFAFCLVNVKEAVTGLSLAPSTVLLSSGQSTTIHATILPDDATNQAVTWQSSDSQIATVDGAGVVTARGEGQVTITATTDDGGFQDTCLVTVTLTQVTGVTIIPQEAYIILGEEFQLTAEVSPSEATNKSVVWYTDNPEVVSVDQSGAVTGLAEGYSVIRVITVDGGLHDTCTVHVRVPVQGVSLNATTLSMERGDKVPLQFTIDPADATNQAVTWESSVPSIATVSDLGLVTAHNHGDTTITVTTVDGHYRALVQVSVWVPLLALLLEQTTAMVGIGETITMVPTFDPSDASDRSLVWSTDNSAIATISPEGVVTGYNIGETSMVATNQRTGLAASCQVEVIIRATGVTISPESLELFLGQSTLITATVQPPEAHVRGVEWSTQDEEIATVSGEGLVTGVGMGQTQITATTVDGGHFVSAAVEVAAIPVEGVSIVPSSLLLFPDQTGQLTAAFTPADATDQSVIWASADEDVATVDSAGLVTGVSAGTATITVTTVDGDHVASATIRVIAVPEGFVLIPSGTFTMGSPSDELGRIAAREVQHQVTLTRSFLMKTTEVTQGEWQALMGYNPSHFNPCGNCPVEQVNWHEALAYANGVSAAEGLAQCFDCTGSGTDVNCSLKAKYTNPQECTGYRLPTEAEWEYAARAGKTTAFHTGEIRYTETCPNMSVAGWYGSNSDSKTHAVGGKAVNAWGLYDMHGNVWEWTWDWYQESLGSTAVIDPYGPSTGSHRVFRGGSWNYSAGNCRAAYRHHGTFPGNRGSNGGFRLARSM